MFSPSGPSETAKKKKRKKKEKKHRALLGFFATHTHTPHYFVCSIVIHVVKVCRPRRLKNFEHKSMMFNTCNICLWSFAILLQLLSKLLPAQFFVSLVLCRPNPLQKFLPGQEPILVVQHQFVVKSSTVYITSPVQLRFF